MAPTTSLNTWYSLREFETRDITARSYGSRHALELSAEKAREISSNFVQAREYFRSASEAEFVVRPLLLYYGVASLARGLTLFLEPSKRECSLEQSHGLQVWEWGQELSKGLTAIGSLRVRMTKGLFHDLLSATGNKFYFRSNSSAVNWSLGAGIPPGNSEIGLKEVAARVPEVSRQFSAWTGEEVASVVLNAVHVDSDAGTYSFTVAKGKEGAVESVFPVRRFDGRTIAAGEGKTIVTTSQGVTPHFSQGSGSFNIGDIFLFEPLDSGMYLTPLASCFMLSFCLGMLCRYFPNTWISIGRTEKGDAFYPLAVRLLDWVEEKFPEMVVDILRGPYEFERK